MEYSNAGTREALLGENATDSLLCKTYSPYMNVHEDIPPVLIVVAEDDKAVPYEQSIRMHQELQKVGVKSDLKIYPSGGHGFWMRSKYKHKNDTYPMIIDWIKQYKDK
jgi:dipeptidyl aminopeptidase/acylaminoacyl peptidase